MVIAASRRNFVGACLGAGCLAGLPLGATQAMARAGIIPPAGPMMLTRLQERSLRDGEAIRVVRSWRVTFETGERGIAIAGNQINVSVEAPAKLAPIAAIEEQRSTADMWPILLGTSGRIIQAGNDVRTDDFATAVQQAEQLIRNDTPGSTDGVARLELLNRLQNVGASLLEQLPEDLFFPSGQPLFSKRELDLPGGLVGEFEVSYDAQPSSQGQWLGIAERRVTTRIDESEKYSLEKWTLSAI